MDKFNIGDVVDTPKGVGVVVDYGTLSAENLILVQIKGFNGHDGCGRAMNGKKKTQDHWYFVEKHLTVIKNKDTIVISRSGRKTTAEQNDMKVSVSRYYEDEEDPETGAIEAIKKLYREKREQKADEWWEKLEEGKAHTVNRHAEPGEYIKIVNASDGNMYAAGDIMVAVHHEATWHLRTGGCVAKNTRGDLLYVSAGNYVVLEEGSPLYNGRVVCIDAGCCQGVYTVGKIYQFVDGRTATDEGIKYPIGYPVRSFDEWQKWSAAKSKFVEIKED